MATHPELVESKKGLVVRVHVQPGAGSTAIVGRHGDALKIRVAAPPADGRANEAVASLLAEEFGLAVGAISLVAGTKSRQKSFALGDLPIEEARGHVDRILARPSHGPR